MPASLPCASSWASDAAGSQSPAPDLLERIAILFVPAFNADGHERFGRWNRPNQVGPEVIGWRTTAQNLNLNRDYTKAASTGDAGDAAAHRTSGIR